MTHPAVWCKSSFSGQKSACVEVRFDTEEIVSIRDSKYLRNPANHPADEPILTVSADDWRTFLAHLTDGSSTPSPISADIDAAGYVTLSAEGSSVTLTYTPTEWDAFCRGVQAGELQPA